MILTPVFGRVYDKKGKGATIMVLGSLLIMVAHVLYAIPQLAFWPVAVGAVILLGFGFSLVPSAMWPSVPRLIPDRQLGTAYALIFFIQNLVALMFVPFLIGTVLDTWCITGTEKVNEMIDGVEQVVTKTYYDYTLPMLVFVVIGLLAVGVALLLKASDRSRGGVLEQPIQK
jgi:MFS family permease